MKSRIGILLVCLATQACGSSAEEATSAPPADTPGATEAPGAERCPSPPVTEAPTPRLGARVYVDISGSMRGFTSRGARRLSSVHQAVADALAEVGARAERCLLGEAFTCEGADAAVAVFDDPHTYNAPTSRLDSVLRRVPVPAQIDPDHPPAPDSLDEAGLTLIVTDGMQVSAASNDSADACAAGGDPHCIAGLIHDRVREGFAFTVVQQMLAFDGPHFAERTLGPDHLAQTQAHLERIRFEPRYNGIEFAARQLTTDAQTGHHSFRYSGTKPLLFFVLGRDAGQVRRFGAALVRELRRQPIHPGQMRPEDSVQFVDVAPLPSGRAIALSALTEAGAEAQHGLSIDRVREVRLSGVSQRDGGLRADLWCGRNGARFYQVSHARSAEPLPPFIVESLVLEGPAGRVPPRVATPAVAVDGVAAYQFGVNCAPLPAGTSTIGYELVRELRVAESEVLANEWWFARSGTSPYETPELPYGLRELVERALVVETAACTTHGRLIVSIEREAG